VTNFCENWTHLTSSCFLQIYVYSLPDRPVNARNIFQSKSLAYIRAIICNLRDVLYLLAYNNSGPQQLYSLNAWHRIHKHWKREDTSRFRKSLETTVGVLRTHGDVILAGGRLSSCFSRLSANTTLAWRLLLARLTKRTHWTKLKWNF